jgi:multiple sugar transport system substrate-binding protein
MKLTRLMLLTLLVVLVSMLSLTVGMAQDEEISGTLNILGFSLPDEIATVRVDQFREQYPDVEVNITEGALDTQQFLTSVVSGNSPDLIYTNRDDLSTFAGRGALMPLDECIANMGVEMSMYREAAVQQVTVDGQVYGIPEFFNVILLIANNAALEEAGLTVEDLDTSDWENITALNEALTVVEDGEVTRIGFDPKLPEFLPLWAMANGVSLISEDGRTAQLNDPAVVEALEFANSLHELAGGRQDFLAFRDTWDFFGAENQVAADQIGVWPMEQWYINVLAGSSPDAPAVFAPFRDREGEILTFATGNTWAIPASSSNPEAACAFAVTMTATETWVAAAEERARLREEAGTTNTGVYTGNREADEIIFGEIVAPGTSEIFDNGVSVALEVMDHAFSIPANPAGAEFRQAWQDAVNRVLNGEQTAQEALDQAQEEAQAALDAAWETE